MSSIPISSGATTTPVVAQASIIGGPYALLNNDTASSPWPRLHEQCDASEWSHSKAFARASILQISSYAPPAHRVGRVCGCGSVATVLSIAVMALMSMNVVRKTMYSVLLKRHARRQTPVQWQLSMRIEGSMRWHKQCVQWTC